VRLIPHYLLGVWALTTHAACGLRYVMLTRGVARSTADRIAIAISVAGAIAATLMVLALCRVHISGT
jgi:succinate dehydrogenase/fumarate reductase cytochrome b subunit